MQCRSQLQNKQRKEINKYHSFKNCRPSTDCTSKINNKQVNNAEHLNDTMPIEYSYYYAQKSGNLRQYHQNHPNDNITYSESFKIKLKMIGRIPVNGNIKDVEMTEHLKYLSNF